MKMTLSRKLVAGVAVTGLLLAAAPVAATSASAAPTACAPGSTCDVTLTGSLGDSPAQIQVPANFNGTVVLYSHGYRIGTPVPAALAVPLGLASDPVSYQRISVPDFAAAFGSTVAYVGTNTPVTAPSTNVAQVLLSQGYAIAGAGYAKQGWATSEGVQAGENLIKYINGGGISGVKKILAWGSSLGGLITATLTERNPGKIAGQLPMCGVLMGPEQAFGSAMTVLFTWKTLIAPTLRVANYQSYPQALNDLATTLTILGSVATRPVSAVGFPIAQANLLSGLMAGLPTKSQVYDGQTVNPAFAQLGTLAALAGGYSPSSAGASTAVAMLQNVGAAAALGILGRYELEQRVRAITGMAATDNANFNDNVNVSYTNLLSPEQRGEFGDVLNASTAVASPLATMLGTLDASKGNSSVRFAANPAAVSAVRSLAHATGKYTNPTIMLTTNYDPVVPAGNTWEYYGLLSDSAKKQGVTPKLAQFYTMPPADGWTQFSPGGKAPNDALSVAALGGTGVGHCNFAAGGGIQMINALTALNRYVQPGANASKIKAANALVYGTVGVNGDGFFEPEPLKHPELSR